MDLIPENIDTNTEKITPSTTATVSTGEVKANYADALSRLQVAVTDDSESRYTVAELFADCESWLDDMSDMDRKIFLQLKVHVYCIHRQI